MSNIEPKRRSVHRDGLILHDPLNVGGLKESYARSRHAYRNRLAIERGKHAHASESLASRVPREILTGGYPAYEDC
jgi:hypothetical protein